MTKRLEFAPAVQIALRGLDPDGVRRVHAWFTYLERWDADEVVRKNSVPLPGHEGVLVLRTTTDIRIFSGSTGIRSQSWILPTPPRSLLRAEFQLQAALVLPISTQIARSSDGQRSQVGYFRSRRLCAGT